MEFCFGVIAGVFAYSFYDDKDYTMAVFMGLLSFVLVFGLI